MDYGNGQKNDLDAFNLDTEEFYLDPNERDTALSQAVPTPGQAPYTPDRSRRNVGNTAIFGANSANNTAGETGKITRVASASTPELGTITPNLPPGYSLQPAPVAEPEQSTNPLAKDVIRIVSKTDDPTPHEAKIINSYVEENDSKLSQDGDIASYYENIRLIGERKEA